jgi:hypothetical protein
VDEDPPNGWKPWTLLAVVVGAGIAVMLVVVLVGTRTGALPPGDNPVLPGILGGLVTSLLWWAIPRAFPRRRPPRD